MAQYIVYSGGASGYTLYDAHPDFPEEYREQVEMLYVRQRIATNDGTLPRCYRFAPLQDRYLFSVIYKECVCEGERRPFFAAVNWLFTAQEADAFFSGDVQEEIAALVQQSDEILLADGYTIPKPQSIVSDYRESITLNAQRALLTAAYNAMRASEDEERALSAQVFLGCAQESNLFSPLFWLLLVIPKRLRKHISFHVGASSPEETKGVSLALTYDELFEQMAANGGYSGTMAIRKVIVLGDEFSSFSEPVSVSEAFLRLSIEQKRRLGMLFLHSDNGGGFWQYIMAEYEQNTALTKGASLAILIGGRAFADALNDGFFSDDELLEMYREKKKLRGYPLLLSLLEERVKSLPGYVSEDVSAETADDKTEEAQKRKKDKHKKDKHRKAKHEKGQEEKRDEQNKEDAYGDGNSDGKDDDEKQKEERHRKRKKKNTHFLKKFFKKCGKVFARIWRISLPLLCIALSWLLPVVLGVGMFFLGVLAVKILPQQLLWAAYGLQIAVLLLAAMPLGHFAISLTQCQLVRWKDDRKARKKKEEDAE